jgi:SAM-dependent methyltransferase
LTPDDERHRRIKGQFGKAAESYRDSPLFAAGHDLRLLLALAAPKGDERLLDVGTGAGHTALAFAPHVREVVGIDLTPEMVAVAEAQPHPGNVRFLVADAEDLPFPDASFDLVTCRYAAHHFPDPGRAGAEMARVLRAGGRLFLVDQVAPEEEEAAAFLNELDRLRDPSHARDEKLSTWRALIGGAGLALGRSEAWALPLDLEDWLRRAQTPPAEAAAVRRLLRQAPQRLKKLFGVTVNAMGDVTSFTVPCLLLEARKDPPSAKPT